MVGTLIRATSKAARPRQDELNGAGSRFIVDLEAGKAKAQNGQASQVSDAPE